MPADPTRPPNPLTPPLQDMRRRLLPGTLNAAAFDGFTRSALKRGAEAAGLDASTVLAAWPNGVDDVIAFWSAEADAAANEALASDEAGAMRIRDKVALGVKARITHFEPDKEAARRAAHALAFPYRHALAARLVWRSADAIWRGLGDKSTDFNYYSKRAILSGVISSTQARWLADESPDGAPTDAFLAARIENVMTFEKVKARIKTPNVSDLVGGLARMRYPGATRD